MKYTYSEMQTYFASRRGYNAFSDMDTKDQTQSKILINLVLERIWFAKQWGFSGDRFQMTFVPSLSGTVTGTAGEHEVTVGSALNESYEGIKLEGQYILIDSRLYKILRRRTSTVLSLDGPLQSTVSAATFKLYFLDYPLPPWVAGVRSIKRNEEDVTFLPEFVSEIDNTEGESDFAHLAGSTQSAFKSNGTVTMTLNSQEVLHSASAEVTQQHVGKAFLLKKSSAYEFYKIIDVDTANNKWIIDRPYLGATEASLTYEIEPRGTQVIRFKPFPTSRELVEIKYTYAPTKLVNDNDRTLLPTDNPMMAGIEVVATQIESVGEGNINEILFKDKKFNQALKSLNFRGSSMQNRMYTQQEVTRLRRWPRNTNPWNQGG